VISRRTNVSVTGSASFSTNRGSGEKKRRRGDRTFPRASSTMPAGASFPPLSNSARHRERGGKGSAVLPAPRPSSSAAVAQS